MFSKFVIFAIILVVAFAAPNPEPEAKADPKADPQLLAYSAPVVAAPAAAFAYPAYADSVAYANYVAPSVYSAGYAYPYSAPYVVV